jgi:hypothetical protein
METRTWGRGRAEEDPSSVTSVASLPLTALCRRGGFEAGPVGRQMVTPMRFRRAKAKTIDRTKNTIIQWIPTPKTSTSVSG